MRSRKFMVPIEPEKFDRFFRQKRIKRSEFCSKIGLSQSGFWTAMARGSIHETQLKLICMMFDVPESTFTPDPEPTENTAQVGYSLSLDVKPDKVRVAVLFEGRELYSAFYKVSDNTETGLLRAISCATHICYEMAQQKELEG